MARRTIDLKNDLHVLDMFRQSYHALDHSVRDRQPWVSNRFLINGNAVTQSASLLLCAPVSPDLEDV